MAKRQTWYDNCDAPYEAGNRHYDEYCAGHADGELFLERQAAREMTLLHEGAEA